MSTGNSSTILPQRSTLDPRYIWDLDVLSCSIESFEGRFDKVSAQLVEPESFRGQLGESAASLLTGLRLRDEALMDVERLDTWARPRRTRSAARSCVTVNRPRGATWICCVPVTACTSTRRSSSAARI